MGITNADVVNELRIAGVSEIGIANYTAHIPLTESNIETIGRFWAAQILGNPAIDINAMVDILLILRDGASDNLWMRTFKLDVLPVILEYKLLGG